MRIEVVVNSMSLDVELDTGASVSTVDEGKLTKLVP